MSNDDVYEPDRLFLTPSDIPPELDSAYVYSAEGIRAAARDLLGAFSWNPGHRQFFPVKANPAPQILRLLLEEGFDLLCTSPSELRLARGIGVPGERILYAAAFDLGLAEAASLGAHVVLSDRRSVELIRNARPASVGLRLHPDRPIMDGARIVVQPEGSKFGMLPRELLEAGRALKAMGVSSVGLHCHLCSFLNAAGYWASLAALLAETGQALTRKTGLDIAYFDVGGGLAVPGRPEDEIPGIETVADRVRERMEALGKTQTPLYTEFGHCVTGPHGVYLTRVVAYRASEPLRPIIGVAGSIMHMGSLPIKHGYHHISILGKSRRSGRQSCAVAGSQSVSGDYFTRKRILPVPEIGDYVAVHGVGAYSESTALLNPGLPPCGSYLYESGALRPIRRPMTAEDFRELFLP